MPIRIEWRRDVLRPPQNLLVFGYPPYPNHEPALHHSRAELHAIPKRIGRDKESLVISSVTRPGFSGGPVLSDRGMVIGVVEQENVGQVEGANPLIYISATPARYCSELNFPAD